MIDGYTELVFLDNRGKPLMPYQWQKRFRHSVQKCNKIYRERLPKITPHVCRHNYCTKMKKCQISDDILKHLMSHLDIRVTANIYSHLKLEDAKSEMERLKKAEDELKNGTRQKKDK